MTNPIDGAGARHLRPSWTEIDLDALVRNLAIVRRLAGGRRLIASVKANGYGHGAVLMAAALARLGVDRLWTGSLDEAIEIRAAVPDARIIMFGGYAPDQMPSLLRHGLVPTIYDEDGAKAVAAGHEPTPVYVKVDSGLGRLGVPIDEAFELIRRIAAMPNIIIEGIYTHLPFGDAAGRVWASNKYQGFEALLARLAAAGIKPLVTQGWASSGLIAGLTDSCNTVCVGHLLYGLSPVEDGIADASELQPVMRAIKTRLIHIAHHAAGRDVAIAGAYGMTNARVTGVVPFGLGDGMRGAAAGQAMSLLVNGQRAPVLGVSLEHTTLDLTGIDEAQIGGEVVVMGESGGARNSFKDLARWFGCGELEAAMAFSKKLPAIAVA
jgi:alanine racemase